MGIFKNQTKQETIVYTIVWILLFLSPLVSLFTNTETNHDPSWVKRSLMDAYGSILVFFIVFLIHNHLLAPIIVKHKRITLYIVCCIALVTVFQLSQCARKPDGRPMTTLNMSETPPPPPPPNGPPPIDKRHLSLFFIVTLMIGANLGMKYYFMNEEEKKHLAKLKEQSLKQELDYLRYQINPHFIMNTLNNIHALVDIDPEQAKDSIVDMSRMMRYMLYDSDKQYVTLPNVVTFLKKYLNLMKLRYTDQVKLNLNVPDSPSEDIVVAPLVFIPFVENAFKHGVSYNKPSEIDISIEKKDDRLVFHSSNTKSNVKHEFGGVGLNNVTKRLELIYGNDYTLDIKDEDDTYSVTLDLPVRYASEFDLSEPDQQEST